MTDISAATLRDLRFSTSTAIVVDELAAFDSCLLEMPDDLERHAALLERLPSLLDLRGRALVHAREYERFLALAEADPSALDERIDTANALAILAHASEIAMLLVPAISPEDRFARTLLSREREQQYRSGAGVHAAELMARALRQPGTADGTGIARNGRVSSEFTEAARRFRGAVSSGRLDGNEFVAGAYRLEDARALEAWFLNPPDLAALLGEARARLDLLDAWSRREDVGPHWYGGTRGALVLAYAELCRIGLWPARSPGDLVAKIDAERLSSGRGCDPDYMRALVEIALGIGRRIARQGPPFVAALSGVEL
jgi:hypothetical protein